MGKPQAGQVHMAIVLKLRVKTSVVFIHSNVCETSDKKRISQSIFALNSRQPDICQLLS